MTIGNSAGCLGCENWTGPRNEYFGDPAGTCSKGLTPRPLYELNGEMFMKGSEVATVDDCAKRLAISMGYSVSEGGR